MNTTELKALAEKATTGPWMWDSDPVKGDPLERSRFRVVATGRTITQCYYSSGDEMAQVEAAYIAAANPAAILELIAAHEDAQGEIRALRERVKALEEGLRDLYKGYVNLLQGGKDRIESLGGACDAVDRMEADSPYLRSARALLEQKP